MMARTVEGTSEASMEENPSINSVATVTSTTEVVNKKVLNRLKMDTNLRTAMGEYIPPKDGKPLTQLAMQLPGPADYSPSLSLTKNSTPHYSIVGKPKGFSMDDFPGPNKYCTEGDMVWRDRGFPMIGKGKSERHDTCSLGPAAYNVDYGNMSTGNAKSAIGTRPKIIHGPPDRTVQPVDSSGFKTPGPAEYRPCSSLWRKNIKKSFGLSLKKERNDHYPGPAEYDRHIEDRGPAYSLGRRFPLTSVDDNPGPGAYDISTTIGTAVSKSMSSRNQIELSNLWTPTPNTYTVPSRIGEGPKYSMTYRSFGRKVSPKPSPASYKPKLDNMNRSAEYSCRKVCRPVYPDILNYAKHSQMKNSIVGPGTYNDDRGITNNDSPAYSMGRRFQKKEEESPGPASYNIKDSAKPVSKNSAAFSMGVRIENKSTSEGPGPAAYYPKVNIAAPKCSMSGRHKKQKGSDTPAANAYVIHSGQTNRGISNGPHPTLKGRPSPFLYSGFRRVLTS